MKDGKDTYLHFGDTAFAVMFHLRYNTMNGAKFDAINTLQISER